MPTRFNRLLLTCLLASVSTNGLAVDISWMGEKVGAAKNEVEKAKGAIRQESCYYAGYIYSAASVMTDNVHQISSSKKVKKKLKRAKRKTNIKSKKCFDGWTVVQLLTLSDGSKKIDKKIVKANKKMKSALKSLDNDKLKREIILNKKALKKQLLAQAKALPVYHSDDVGVTSGRGWKPNICFSIGEINFLAELAMADEANINLQQALEKPLRSLKDEICLDRRWTEKYRRERLELIHYLERYNAK
ncbi:MAG: hypothetical protein JNM93_04470 [Bacteriovoracaceae bacterium]|nr:hypothetical protein [Bacteriovoracaceae bacterium]